MQKMAFSTSNQFYFSPIPSSMAQDLMHFVVDFVEENDITVLKGIGSNYSAERGFTLEFTPFWRSRVPEHLKKYHSYRDFRFIWENNGTQLVGLRCKDDLKCWDEHEINAFKSCIRAFMRK